MGKLTLLVLVLAIALGAYWFWWSDQGANDPITVEGKLSISGVPGLPGLASVLPTQGSGNVDFTLQAVPNKLKFSGTAQGEKVSFIVRLDKREMHILNHKRKVYASQEFDFVDMSETEQDEKSGETWFEALTRTADWAYIGTGDGKRFCNKQAPTELSKGNPGRAELWFTPDTRLGRRYFSTLNRLFRIQPVGNSKQWGMFNLGAMQSLFNGNTAQNEKRPQLKYVNLDFFPVPMKADVAFGPMRFKLDVKNLSREKIPKDTFEIPSDYTLDNNLTRAPRPATAPARNIANQPRPETIRFVVPKRTQRRQVVVPRRTPPRRSSGST